jgi:hypothetical protein
MPIQWFKVWVDGWLDGTIRLELNEAERGIFIDLLAMAARSRLVGIVCAGENYPYPHEVLAKRLGIEINLFNDTLKKLETQQRITEDQKGIHISNWEDYQSPQSVDKSDQTFEEYVEELRGEFKDIGDYDDQFKKFNLYWGEGKKKLKRPKLAWRNWLVNARKYKEEKNGKGRQNNRGIAEQYETPEEYLERYKKSTSNTSIK